MPEGLHHSARSLKVSTGIEVISKFNIPADDTNAFGNRESAFIVVLFTELCFAPRWEIVTDRVGSNNLIIDYCWLMCTGIEI